MLPLIVVRPEPGAGATLAAARALGLDAHAFPIFAVRAIPWAPVPCGEVDAVVFGSANALRHGGSALAGLRGLPAYCVGETTAAAAQALGFEIVRVGTGGLRQVLDTLDPAHRRLLRLAGAAHVPLHLPAGVTMETRVVYASEPVRSNDELARRLNDPAVVMIHSGEAASRFAVLCQEGAICRSRIALAVIGPRAVPLAGEGWSAVRCAEKPSDAALLALAQEMCQDFAGPP